MNLNNDWLDPEKTEPKNGETYLCKVKRNNSVKEVKKIYKNGLWFGGCRPFCDSDIVLYYMNIPK